MRQHDLVLTGRRPGAALLGAVAGAVILLALTAAPAEACQISFEPAQVMVGADGKGTVKAIVKWEHRRCVLRDDEINIEGTGVTVDRTSGWERTERGVFENEIAFTLTATEGTIRVWRECSKKGVSEWLLRVTRKP